MSFKPIKSVFTNNLIYIILETEECGNIKLFTTTCNSQAIYLNLPKKPYPNNYFPRTKISNYHGEHPYGEGLGGILGYPFFNRRIWNIDYKRRVIAIYSLDLYKFIKSRIPAYIGRESPYVSVPIKIGSREYWFLVDTGAYLTRPAETYKDDLSEIENREATSYILKSFVKKLNHRRIAIKEVKKADKEGRDMIMLPSIKIGKYVIENAKFIVLNSYCCDTLQTLTNKPIKGAIGGNILKNFNVIINYPESYVWLRRSSTLSK